VRRSAREREPGRDLEVVAAVEAQEDRRER
jgi:hypothetical protein